jgi:hypothetical protein
MSNQNTATFSFIDINGEEISSMAGSHSYFQELTYNITSDLMFNGTTTGNASIYTDASPYISIPKKKSSMLDELLQVLEVKKLTIY